MLRSAMSMIELVFAIVIMGIAVMTLPLVLTQVQNNNAFAIQQEAILAAKAKMGDLLTYEWDENSYVSGDSHSYVLDVTNGDAELNATAGTPRRVGHIDTDYRRKFFSVPRLASVIGADGGDLDDVDDFNGTATIIALTVVTEGAGTLDYVFDLNLTTTVAYAADSANYSVTPLIFTLNPDDNKSITNIKTIEVAVLGAPSTVRLRAFTCNIGESKLLPSRPYR